MPDESKVLRIGQWRVDPNLDELSREGQTIRLEPRPMRLLLYLAANAGQVVEVRRLLDEVWPNVIVTPGSVYQAIADLRRILGDHTERPSYIENLPRRGYRLVAPVTPWNAANSAAPSDSTAVGSSPMTSAPIPAEVKSVSASPDRLADTGTEAVAAAKPLPAGRLRRSALLGGVALAAVIVAGIAFDAFWRVHHMPVTGVPAAGKTEVLVTPATFAPPPHSIAVLPFVNLSGDKEQEYFSDGLTEELLNSLSRINELQVAGRTSSFYFKGEHADLATIAHKLNVATVLEGGVRRSAHTVRVSAQLINAETGFHLWSETYDRDLGDVLKLQTEIATAVASAEIRRPRSSLVGRTIRPRLTLTCAAPKRRPPTTAWRICRPRSLPILKRSASIPITRSLSPVDPLRFRSVPYSPSPVAKESWPQRKPMRRTQLPWRRR